MSNAVDCPQGTENRMNIDKVKEVMEIKMDRLEEKFDDLTDVVKNGFAEINKKNDTMSKSIEMLKDNTEKKVNKNDISKMIEEKLIDNRKDALYSGGRWFIGGFLSVIVVSVVRAYILSKLGL